jgi:signal transduction histidine kinase
LVNILSNAIKFTPSGGRVTVTNERDAEGALRISITDTGIGLDAHEIEKALSPFGQVENAFNRANAGTGLGLTLSDALIKLHDGRLELLSQKGIGTTVTIVIPLDRVDQQSTPTSAPSASASTDSQQY